MFKVRAQQFETLEKQGQHEFPSRVLAHLRQHHSECTLKVSNGRETASEAIKNVSESTLRTLIARGLERAAGFGLTWQSSLLAFVVTMFVCSPNFCEHPKMARIMRDARIPPNLRLLAAVRLMSLQDWDAAAQMYRPESWLRNSN